MLLIFPSPRLDAMPCRLRDTSRQAGYGVTNGCALSVIARDAAGPAVRHVDLSALLCWPNDGHPQLAPATRLQDEVLSKGWGRASEPASPDAPDIRFTSRRRHGVIRWIHDSGVGCLSLSCPFPFSWPPMLELTFSRVPGKHCLEEAHYTVRREVKRERERTHKAFVIQNMLCHVMVSCITVYSTEHTCL